MRTVMTEQERINILLEAIGDIAQRAKRMSVAIHKLSKWSGVDISELVDEGYLEEGDMD